MFVSFSLMEYKRRLSGCGETIQMYRGETGRDKIKAGRDSPLIESRPAFSLAVGIVLTRLYRRQHAHSVRFRTHD
jgi:hypothetical protein